MVVRDWVELIGAETIRASEHRALLVETELAEESLEAAFEPLAEVLAHFNMRLPNVCKWRVSWACLMMHI